MCKCIVCFVYRKVQIAQNTEVCALIKSEVLYSLKFKVLNSKFEVEGLNCTKHKGVC